MEKDLESILSELSFSLCRPRVGEQGMVLLVQNGHERDWIVNSFRQYLATPDCFWPEDTKVLFKNGHPIYSLDLFDCQVANARSYQPFPFLHYLNDDESEWECHELDTSKEYKVHVFINYEYASDDNQRDIESIIRSKNDELRFLVAIKDDFLKDLNNNSCYLYLVRDCYCYEVSSNGQTSEEFIAKLINNLRSIQELAKNNSSLPN